MSATLITDLDGTLIPLADNSRNQIDLTALKTLLTERGIAIVFATGRHPESMQDAMRQFDLPGPDYAICNVGTEILQWESANNQFGAITEYQQHLTELTAALPADQLTELCTQISGLQLQEPAKLSRHKVSFYVNAEELDSLSKTLDHQLQQEDAPWSMISSVDPFTGDGLIDVLPRGVSKAYAIQWWANEINGNSGQILYAGDSGNDVAALTAGYDSIVVGNADQKTKDQVAAQTVNTPERVHFARGVATSGVLEGLIALHSA